MPSQVTLRNLLEVGVHFGHRTQKWNPRMDPYIFTSRNGIHILDLQQTIKHLNDYHDLIRDTVAGGGVVLFVGTKRQAAETIKQEANRCGMPYVNHRWLGGTLTNWTTIRKRIDQLKKLEQRRDKGEFERLTKKEALMLEREIEKLQLRLGGIRNMKKVPDLVFIVDTVREDTAVKECNILDVPIIALVDSNSDPDQIDYILPSNDDAMRAIKLMVSAIADAVLAGRAMRKGESDEDDDFDTMSEEVLSRYDNNNDSDEDASDEDYLGESTLAKIRSQKQLLDEDDEDEDN
ncbi:MAG: 30S ribosomal protein S2 [Chloroflexota bacterium]